MKQTVQRGDQTLVVTSNGHPQLLQTWNDLDPKDRADFDYLDEEQRDETRFARIGGDWLDVHDMETTRRGLSAPDPGILASLGWDGVQTTSHWTGIVAKLSYDGQAATLGRFVISG
jgi:hypothetical protein